MPSVALTCPLWWVARSAARMLTSLAVAVAFSLGAGSLPFDAVIPADASAVRSPAGGLSISAVGHTDPGAPFAGRPVVLGAPAGAAPAPGAPVGLRAVADHAAASVGTAAAYTANALPAGAAMPPLPTAHPVARAAGPGRAPLGPAPAASGPRAPPRP
ncbi:hypothetical protein [Micromonospora sp. NPDC048830]|uniref:hypothetical protein n=1 Tax=Micromonospora sp. NPDC048830 TaxID=3364257 RepID=UPI0037220A85